MGGIHDPATIDLVAGTDDPRHIHLLIVEDGEWVGDDSQLDALEAKVNAYVQYALDGQLASDHPEMADSPTDIVLRISQELDDRTTAFLALLRSAVEQHDLGFRVWLPTSTGDPATWLTP